MLKRRIPKRRPPDGYDFYFSPIYQYDVDPDLIDPFPLTESQERYYFWECVVLYTLGFAFWISLFATLITLISA